MKAKSNNYRGKVDISVSQNFITSKNTIYKLIKKTNISKNDFVIEIGPGKGHITEALCEKSYWVTAIELDRSLYGNLINKFKIKNNVTLINKDFLNWKLPKKREYKVFSNIPFYITTKIIKKLLLEELNSPTDMWLVMEKGSAKRFMGIPRESKLSLLLKTKFDIKIVHYFNREDFHPMPSVDCVLVYFKRKYKYDISKDEWNEYTSFISKSINNLRDVFTKNQIHAVIKYLGINLNNISEVSYNDWIQLFRYKQKID